MVAQGKIAIEVVVYMVPGILVVLLAAVLVLSGGPPLSQSMNRTSFPGENHKRNRFFRHFQLIDKTYNTNSSAL